jgi:hypothetical protein
MGRWLITTLLLASGSLPSVALAGKNSQSANGITGQILLGPTCPVARPGDAKCKDQPYETTMIIKTADGKRVTELRSDSNGDFRVPLRPGSYRLEVPEGGPRYPRTSPQQITVKRGQYTRVTIRFDTGMR